MNDLERKILKQRWLKKLSLLKKAIEKQYLDIASIPTTSQSFDAIALQVAYINKGNVHRLSNLVRYKKYTLSKLEMKHMNYLWDKYKA